MSVILNIVSCHSKTSPIDTKNIDLMDLDKADAFKMSFKEFLKKGKVDMEITIPNKYETLLPGNLYSNYYFNLTTDFPDNWKIDRGVSDYSIIRASIEDSAMTIALIAVPANLKNSSEESHEDFQRAPLNTMNKTFGDYKNYMAEQLNSVSKIKPYDLSMHEEKIRNTNYLVYSYKYNETVEGNKYAGKTLGYQTVLWGVSYTLEYTAPDIFFNLEIIKSAVSNTNYLNPELLNSAEK